MDISIYKTDNKYSIPTQENKIAVFSSYSSLIWCKRYKDIGALDLEVEATMENITTFQKGYLITREDDDVFFIITKLELETNEDKNLKLIVGAVESKSWLSQRIILNYVSSTNATLRSHLEKLLLNIKGGNRYLPCEDKISIIGVNFDYTLVEDKARFNNLAEKIIALAQTYNFGWKITKDYELIFYFGEDKSSTVVFSPEYDNISTSKYEVDSSEYKNVCYVTGSGEDYEKLFRLTYKGKAEPFSTYRFETSVDSDSDEDNIINIGAGKEELAKCVSSVKFEASVIDNSFKYKEDYNLGDIVTIENELGVKVTARIIEIVETWDNEGYTLEPTFEYINLSDDDDLVTEEMFETPIQTENKTELEVEE